MPGFQALREQARRDIHAAFAVPALLNDTVELSVRWHDRFVRAVGDEGGGGPFAQYLENVDKLIFDDLELSTKAVVLKRGDRITLTDYEDFVLILDSRDPKDGPVKVTWNVVRPKPP